MQLHSALLSWTLAVVLVLCSVLWSALSEAQQPAKVPRIGYLESGSRSVEFQNGRRWETPTGLTCPSPSATCF